MSGCYGSSPEDRYWENRLNKHLDSQDQTDTPAFEDKKEEIIAERFKDTFGWFLEGITESSDENLAELRDAIQSGDNLKTGDILSDCVYRYITPDDDFVLEELNQEPDCED